MVAFASMNAHAPMALSRLRDVGWKEWDPIGLLAAGEAWDQKPFADEYDDYLRKVAATAEATARAIQRSVTASA